MLEKTKGIVLYYIKYSETSVIATIYTEKFGRQSYIINGVRGKRAKVRVNILQPLFLLDMEVVHKPNRELQRIKEIRTDYIFSSLPYDIRKSTLAIFISEILSKTIVEQESNPELFRFLYNSIQLLDLKEEGVSNFHLFFLMRLSKYLGFFPENNYSDTCCFFDFKLGSFVAIKPLHTLFLDKDKSSIFNKLLSFNENQQENIVIANEKRTIILDKILEYYSLHNEGASRIKSLRILHEVFH